MLILKEKQFLKSVPEMLHSCLTDSYTIKPVLSNHSKEDIKTDNSLMQVISIAECSLGAFCNTFEQH